MRTNRRDQNLGARILTPLAFACALAVSASIAQAQVYEVVHDFDADHREPHGPLMRGSDGRTRRRVRGQSVPAALTQIGEES